MTSPAVTEKHTLLDAIYSAKSLVQIVENPRNLTNEVIDSLIAATQRGISVELAYWPHKSTQGIAKYLAQNNITLYETESDPETSIVLIDRHDPLDSGQHMVEELDKIKYDAIQFMFMYRF